MTTSLAETTAAPLAGGGAAAMAAWDRGGGADGVGGSAFARPACWTSAATLAVSCRIDSAVRACDRASSVKALSIAFMRVVV